MDVEITDDGGTQKDENISMIPDPHDPAYLKKKKRRNTTLNQKTTVTPQQKAKKARTDAIRTGIEIENETLSYFESLKRPESNHQCFNHAQLFNAFASKVEQEKLVTAGASPTIAEIKTAHGQNLRRSGLFSVFDDDGDV